MNKTLLLATLGMLALLVVPAADAQITKSQLVLSMEAPQAPLTHDAEIASVPGITTFTGDIGQYQHTTGIPITYSVTKAPEWATVTVVPASDVIPLPAAPGLGLSFTVSRPFTVTIILDPEYEGRDISQVEITVTQGAVTGGMPASAKNAIPIMADASPVEPCPEHAVTQEQLSVWAVEAADAYNEYQAAAQEEDPEVTTQSAGASPVPLPWVAVGGFALVGAAVGLVLRKRLAR